MSEAPPHYHVLVRDDGTTSDTAYADRATTEEVARRLRRFRRDAWVDVEECRRGDCPLPKIG